MTEQPAMTSTNADQIKKDAALLMLYRTQLKGLTDLSTTASLTFALRWFFRG